MASQQDIADHLGISQSAVSALVRADVFEKRPRGGFDLDECRTAYLRRLREEAAGRAAQGDREDGDLDIVAERARLAKEQADRLEMENALRRQELVEFDHFVARVGQLLATVRTRLLALPAECAVQWAAAQTPAVAEAVIRDVVYQALEELSSGGGRVADDIGAKGDDLAKLTGEAAAAPKRARKRTTPKKGAAR